ncbi:FliH/SctL family protein [Phycisphaera mikurensis]|uniref:Flagellar assembly protein FliH n=1 Tax=Phycisphaera mikurensis (strain NBRC 102666 / KCTC 22515 / FYK2301M01) TaxID=1142394 RepID=I0IGE3_PHYMF|nr:FliH/SctL family protein [Phycisphaera mikurensis]MBB6440291.1 flagellar assembly protein FliH [Phycisphaera mikurensis]BAM04331.1 putative flagellar assembly protein FliH [Phycisphaera mikurensis NBRC 102666]
MPLLKKNPAGSPHAVVLDLTDLGRQAQRLREAVRAEAEGVLEAAKEQAAGLAAVAEAAAREEGEAAGRAQGHAAGLEAGREEAREAESARLADVAAVWKEAAEGVASVRESVRLEAETAVLRLALALAEKVVARHLDTQPDAAVDAVREALSHVLEPVQAVVRVAPEELERVKAALPDLAAAGGGAVRVEADAAVPPRGCVVTHGAGRVDAGVATKLERLAVLLLGERAEAAEAAEGRPPEEAAPAAAEGAAAGEGA